MAKSKIGDLPHHVKERLRHQKLQKILENVANHIPKPATTKRETKAKKLRRVVLYMKYLIHKNKELNKRKLVAVKRTTKCQDISEKTNVASLEFPSKHKHRSKRAHIVFLTKFSEASESNTENGLALQTTKNTVNVIDQSKSRNVLLSENGLELHHEKSIKSAADRYVPNGELENLSDYDRDLWKEDFPAISKSSAEKEVGKSGNNYIFRDQIFNDCINEREDTDNKLDRNGTGLEQYVQEFSTDLEKMHKSNSDKTLFQSDKLERSCLGIHNIKKETDFTNSCKKLSPYAEYSFHKVERPCSFNEFVSLKNYHSSCDAEVYKHQITEQETLSQNSDDFSFGESDTYTTLNNFEIPRSFNKSETLKNDEKYFDMKMHKHQNSKYKIFSPGSDDLSPDFFSSGESSTLTSLHNFGKPHVSSCSERPKNYHPNYCDGNVEKHQLSKHPSFSQSSDNFSSDIVSSGESGAVISSNENVLSESDRIGFADYLHRSPDTLLKPESVMDEDSFDYSLTPPQRNHDIITSPDIFCDMKQDVRHVSSDFSVDNILSKPCLKNSPLFSPNSERYLDYNIHESNYNVPFIHNNTYSNAVDNRFINYFGMNNFSQNLPLHALPPFSQIGNYPTMNMGSVARYSNIVPNDKIFSNTYCPANAFDFNHSMYVSEDMGNYLRVPIKQKDMESFLPPEELSYSLNNFGNSGYCFSQRNFNTQ